MSWNECFVRNNFHSIDRHPQHILGWMCYLYDTYIWYWCLTPTPSKFEKAAPFAVQGESSSQFENFLTFGNRVFLVPRKLRWSCLFFKGFQGEVGIMISTRFQEVVCSVTEGNMFFIRDCLEHKSWKLMVFDKDVQDQIVCSNSKKNMEITKFKNQVIQSDLFIPQLEVT